MERKKINKLLIWMVILSPVLFFLIPILVGLILTHPFRRKTEQTPADYNLQFEEVEFKSNLDQVVIRGWWIPAKNPTGKTVITAHGYTDERSQKKINGLRIVQSIHDRGYNVLMFDFRNSGKSGGRTTGIGYYEQHDLSSAVEYVINERNQQEIVLLGWSMGGATCLLVGSLHPQIKGVIADSPFHDLQTYLEDNLSVWSKLPKKPFTSIILRSMKHLLKIDPKEVSPVISVQKGNSTNYLLIHGKNDLKVPFSSSEMIYDQIPNDNEKTLWLTEHGHITTFIEEPEPYTKKVIDFIEKTFSSNGS
ncbi:alpha/beta hydrolase [Gottfriedia sp. NPDC058432]|uniref:alpha/beta hydrolase n=1 Tax=Gottfriedia sp. NPDC058432 TaxID=3346497 RepID=UPI0036539048